MTTALPQLPHLPEDLTGLSAEKFASLSESVRAYAASLLEASPTVGVEQLTEANACYQAILTERGRRDTAEQTRKSLQSALEENTPEDPEEEIPDPEGDDSTTGTEETTPVVTANQGRTTKKRSTLDQPSPVNHTDGHVIMLTAPDVPGMAGGQPLATFAEAVKAVDARLRAYTPSALPARRPLPIRGKQTFQVHPGRTAVRHGAVAFHRRFPEDLRINDSDTGRAWKVAQFAATESRLPGGSLIESAKAQLKKGRALTAAIGWCAPSETMYDLCELSSLDGILDLPEVQAARGGFQLPADGGPDFSVVWDSIGSDGDVILTEYDVENGAIKECFEIPCPDFVDVRLDIAYLCLTGSLLQRRGFPEVVEFFSQESVRALAHKINASVIARIAASSGPATVIPADPSGDDAASALLNAVALAIEDVKYRHRMSRNRTLEVVLPYWALVQVKAALSRRHGVAMMDVTDSMIMDWFSERGAMPRFVYDWQDAYTGLPSGPGGATPISALPTTVQFLVYPSGTWTKAVQDVVNLDTIFDNALLTTNEYTAIFVEDGFNVLQMCPDSRLYTVTVDPSGVVGCCPA